MQRKMQNRRNSENFSHCRFCGRIKKKNELRYYIKNESTIKDFFQLFKPDIINIKSDIMPKTSCKPCADLLLKCMHFIQRLKHTKNYLSNVYKYSKEQLLEMQDSVENFDYGEDFSSKPKMIINIDANIDTKEQDLNTKTDFHISKNENNFDLLQANFKDEIANIKTPDVNQPRILENNNTNILTWADYEWTCVHCQAKFNSMHAVRDHSKVVHAICYGFQCNNCKEIFNYFNPFVEHLRQHWENLRLYCQFCNHKSSTANETIDHLVTHFSTSHICLRCGEMLPNIPALDRHKKVFKKAILPQRCYKKKPMKVEGNLTWMEYEWSCQDCSLRLPSIVSLRSHTRDVHNKCFAMKCADCLTMLSNYKQFVEHVTTHRICLKNYCPYCNIKLNNSTIEDHMSTHISGVQKLCLGCGEVFPDSDSLARHKTLYDAPKIRGFSDAEGLTCGVCQKKFANSFQLKNHKVIHKEERERDQVCETCGKAFFDEKTLRNHINTHKTNTETCEVCRKTFLNKQRLKTHIASHLDLKQFVCNECGKSFRRKSHLSQHMMSHSDVMPYKCSTCNKRFRMPSYLRLHERRHTGARPYECDICHDTFNHWGNCNRHMLKKHGITFAKAKFTAQGKVDINRETGEIKEIHIEDAREWCEEMLKPAKRGRKKKE